MLKQTSFAKALLFFVFAVLTVTVSAQNCDTYEKLIATMDKSFEEKNVDLLDKVYHQDVVFHGVNGDTKGLDAMKESQKKFFEEIPDAHGTNDQVICSDDHIIVRWTGTGTPKGAEKSIKVTGITIYKVVKGKVKEAWEEMNELSVVMQMGYELKPPATMEKSTEKQSDK